jgi:hypothetical protein
MHALKHTPLTPIQALSRRNILPIAIAAATLPPRLLIPKWVP